MHFYTKSFYLVKESGVTVHEPRSLTISFRELQTILSNNDIPCVGILYNISYIS